MDWWLVAILIGGLILLAAAALADRRTRGGRPRPTSVNDTAYRRLASRPDAITVDARLAADSFANSSGHCALEHPSVLVLADPARSVRELVRTLGRVAAERRTLAVVAPEFSDAVVELLATNRAEGTLDAAPILADADTRRTIVDAAKATPTSRADLQSDSAHTNLGRCEWVISSPTECLVIPASKNTIPPQVR